jgi:hypothetical protein
MVTIEVSAPDRREALRDYFLRLGTGAAVDEQGFVNVSVEREDDLDVAEYLESWVESNRTPATILPTLSPPDADELAP